MKTKNSLEKGKSYLLKIKTGNKAVEKASIVLALARIHFEKKILSLELNAFRKL